MDSGPRNGARLDGRVFGAGVQVDHVAVLERCAGLGADVAAAPRRRRRAAHPAGQAREPHRQEGSARRLRLPPGSLRPRRPLQVPKRHRRINTRWN